MATPYKNIPGKNISKMYDFFEITSTGHSLKRYVKHIRELPAKYRSEWLQDIVKKFFREISLNDLNPDEIHSIIYILKETGVTFDEIWTWAAFYEGRTDKETQHFRDIIYKGFRKINAESPYISVGDYYKQDCKSTDKCDCVPYDDAYRYKYPCGFIDEKLITDPRQKMDILISYGYEIKTASQEALDFIEQFPIFILRKGTTLCHSTHAKSILSPGNREFKIAKSIWWREYFVGQDKYKGGWFTYETPYGGPNFGMSLFYQVEQDIPILFVPNYRKHAGNSEYFSQKHPWNRRDDKSWNPNDFTGSHLVQGVKGWNKKGYKMIQPRFFADEFAERITSLGFPGYVSCDECEIFITHKSMERMLTSPPYRVKVEISSVKTYKTTFDKIVELLCGEDKHCPLKINTKDKDRNSVIDMQILDYKKLNTDYLEFGEQYRDDMDSISSKIFEYDYRPK